MNVFLSKAHQGTQEAVQECPVQRERKKECFEYRCNIFFLKNAASKLGLPLRDREEVPEGGQAEMQQGTCDTSSTKRYICLNRNNASFSP